MAAYLTPVEAATRLSSYGYDATLTDGDVTIASNELDAAGPFIGARFDYEQERAFPRDLTPQGDYDDSGEVPDTILDAVALLAYHATLDEGGAITSESVLDMSVTYAAPKENRNVRQIHALVAPYLLRAGARR